MAESCLFYQFSSNCGDSTENDVSVSMSWFIFLCGGDGEVGTDIGWLY